MLDTLLNSQPVSNSDWLVAQRAYVDSDTRGELLAAFHVGIESSHPILP